MENGHSGRRRFKIINDALHGNITIEGRCLSILDTPEFQRLRHIRQLQACHYVYPSAQHTRLEHSLGTHYLAGVVMETLRKKQPELEIEEGDIELVQMAGLCHDIGHGCFSHMLDYELFPKIVSNFNWKHETRSCELLEYMEKRNHLDLDASTIKNIQSLILGDRSKSAMDLSLGKKYLWDIVAQENTGIDVDKFDYLARDSRNCNIKIGFDHHRAIELMRVVDDEICFNSRGAEAVYDLFNARSRMYRNAYFHKVTRSVERMIADAIFEANHVLKLQDCIGNLEKFCKLDDTILREIHRSEDPSLAKAQAIITRIEKRDLYRYVDEFVVPLQAVNGFKELSVDDFMMYKPSSSSVTSNDLVLQILKIDYGRGNDNPVDKVHFFDDRETVPKKIYISRARVSNLIPQNYRDITVRLYIKTRDAKLEDEAREMFTAYQNKVFGGEVMRTPSLKRKADDLDDDGEEFNLSQTQTMRRLIPESSS